jgi:hypothetical protein
MVHSQEDQGTRSGLRQLPRDSTGVTADLRFGRNSATKSYPRSGKTGRGWWQLAAAGSAITLNYRAGSKGERSVGGFGTRQDVRASWVIVSSRLTSHEAFTLTLPFPSFVVCSNFSPSQAHFFVTRRRRHL